MKLTKLKYESRVKVYFFIFSIVLTTFIAILFYHVIRPYSFEEMSLQTGYDHIMYSDINDNDFSERIEFCNKYDQKDFHILITNSHRSQRRTGQIVDQFNFTHSLNYKWVFFKNLNRGSTKEMIVFTNDESFLYLSIINIEQKSWILKNYILLKRPADDPHPKWHLKEIFVEATDLNLDGKIELIVAIRAGFSRQPRGVIIFNLDSLKIEHQFFTEAAIHRLDLFDINQDGKKEIIISGRTTDNYNDYEGKITHSDKYCWTFILDEKLNILNSMRYGKYPSNYKTRPIKMVDQSVLLGAYTYIGAPRSHETELFYIDSNATIIKKNILTPDLFSSLILDERDAEHYIYLSFLDGTILKTDKYLQIVLREKIAKNLRFINFIDIDIDGNREILAFSDKGFHVLNNELEELAFLPGVKGKLYLKKNSTFANIELVFNEKEALKIYSYQRNFIHQYLLVLAMLVSVISFFVLWRFRLISGFIFSIFRSMIYITTMNNQGIIIVNTSGRIIYLNNIENHPFLSPLVLKKADNIEKLLKILPQDVDPFKKMLNHFPTDLRSTTIPINSTHFNGEITLKPIVLSIFYYRVVLIIIRDITPSLKSESLRIWSQISQRIAHDIKTPLSTIKLNLRAMQMHLHDQDIPKWEELCDDIEMIQGEVQKIQETTKSFLKFSNLEKPNIQIQDLKEIIDNSIKSFHAYFNHDLQIEIEVSAETENISVDIRQFEIVLHILIENAIDAMKGKGVISIKSNLIEKLENRIEKYIEIEVADSGPGIEEKNLKNIFEPYYSTKRDGTGMGLAIAKKVVEDHQGTISAYSREGLGTAFKISLPLINNT